MSRRKKLIHFIRENRNLPVPELASKTGLPEEEITGLIDKLKSESRGQQANGSGTYPSWVYPLIIAVLTFVIYLPGLKNGFVDWDDPQVVTNNSHIQALTAQNVYWMLTTFTGGIWMPLTWLSFAIDYLIGGMHPWLFHFTNIMLHVLNTVLVYFLCHTLLRLATSRSEAEVKDKNQIIRSGTFLTALLFGLHPVHVESVAWITERKDVLYAFFYLSAIIMYLEYISSQRTRKFYGSLLLFACALMSKPMAVSLPVVLVIIDIWLLGRFKSSLKKAVTEKIPFLAIAIVSSLIAVIAQGQAAYAMAGNLPLYFRMSNAIRSLALYLSKMFIPWNLVPLYPFPHTMGGGYYAETILSVFLVLGISLVCFWYRKKAPALLATWLYYLVTLAPVLGLIQVGIQAAADRYTYLPSLGIFLPVSAAISISLSKNRSYFSILVLSLVVVLGFLTINQIGVWRDSITLWETVLRQYPDDTPQFAHKNLAAAYQVGGRLTDALGEYDKAIALSPTDASVHANKATVLFDLGKQSEAIQEAQYAITLEPGNYSAHKNLAIMYKRMGLEREAEAEVQATLKIQQSDLSPQN